MPPSPQTDRAPGLRARPGFAGRFNPGFAGRFNPGFASHFNTGFAGRFPVPHIWSPALQDRARR